MLTLFSSKRQMDFFRNDAKRFKRKINNIKKSRRRIKLWVLALESVKARWFKLKQSSHALVRKTSVFHLGRKLCAFLRWDISILWVPRISQYFPKRGQPLNSKRIQIRRKTVTAFWLKIWKFTASKNNSSLSCLPKHRTSAYLKSSRNYWEKV